jgi:ketosteroid isomerase-like protein
MAEATSEVFLKSAYTGAGWEPTRRILENPRKDGASLEELREEMAIRDLVARFNHAIDLHDFDGMMRCLTDDCVVTTSRGTVSGIEAVRKDYEEHFSEVRRFHVWSNVVVQLSDDLRSGGVTSNFFAIQARDEGAVGVGGVLAQKVRKENGSWKIYEREGSADLKCQIAAL